MKRMLFVFNPNTGGGRLKFRLMPILCTFGAAGYEVIAHPTACVGDARDVVRKKAKRVHMVVCCGGDGTLNEVVHGLMELENPPLLAYIPGGTTNDFASSLHLPKSNMVNAAKRAVHPKKVFKCDIGAFNERVFNYVAAFGAFTDVSYQTPQAFKNVLGYFAYVLEGIARLPNLQAHRMRVRFDGGEIEDEFLFGMLSNSTSVGGFSFMEKKSVRMDDGYFEMLLVRKPANILELGGLPAALITRNAASSPLIVAARVQQVQILSDEAIPWTLDGEFGGSLHEVKVAVQKQALRICI